MYGSSERKNWFKDSSLLPKSLFGSSRSKPQSPLVPSRKLALPHCSTPLLNSWWGCWDNIRMRLYRVIKRIFFFSFAQWLVRWDINGSHFIKWVKKGGERDCSGSPSNGGWCSSTHLERNWVVEILRTHTSGIRRKRVSLSLKWAIFQKPSWP